MVMADVKSLYKQGADAVELEMITENEFNKLLLKNYTPDEQRLL